MTHFCTSLWFSRPETCISMDATSCLSGGSPRAPAHIPQQLPYLTTRVHRGGHTCPIPQLAKPPSVLDINELNKRIQC